MQTGAGSLKNLPLILLYYWSFYKGGALIASNNWVVDDLYKVKIQFNFRLQL